MNKKALIVLLLSFEVIFAFGQDAVSGLKLSHGIDSVLSDPFWINQHTFISGPSHTGIIFSRTDSTNLYGIGYKGQVPTSFQNRNLRLRVSAFARLIGQGGRSSLVISILFDDSTVYWENRQIVPRVSEQNKWTKIDDEVSIPSNLTGKDYTLLIYFWNETANVICDIDDFELEFSELSLPSFLIKSASEFVPSSSEDFIEVYSGTYFRMEYNKISSQFRIRSPDKQLLLHSFEIYSSWRTNDKNGSANFEKRHNAFFLRGDSKSEEGRIFILEARSEIMELQMSLLFSDIEPIISFQINSKFLDDIDLDRISLAATFSPELKEVYRSSNFRDSAHFQDEYWLGKGGIQVYSDSAGFILYQNSNISSLQVKPSEKRIIINLDWELDHPLLHFPLLQESINKHENHSSRSVKKGSSLINSFRFQGIRLARIVPRISKFSFGRSAAMIWTEHADYSDLQIQRAVNFGADSIVESSKAKGGFVKHNIPVTKSVFYANPDKVMNSMKLGFLKTEIATVKGTPGFKDFLLDLHNQGHEICLHTPDHFTSDRSLLDESLAYMSEEFKLVSWIDHGYDNGIKSNREDLVCDGLDSKSKHYCADLWKKYGVKYFWNCFYEDTSLYAERSFNSFMTVPYYGWGDRFPVPEYWKHFSRSGDIIHWRTSGTLDPQNGTMWNYLLSLNRLEDLIQSRAVSIIHAYPARADSTNGFYEMEDKGFVIQKAFDDALARMASLRDEGLLQLCTIENYLDYNIALENVQISFLTSGKVKIENKNPFMIKGFTIILPSYTRLGVREKKVNSRTEADDNFWWFDINANESVILDIL